MTEVRVLPASFQTVSGGHRAWDMTEETEPEMVSGVKFRLFVWFDKNRIDCQYFNFNHQMTSKNYFNHRLFNHFF